MPSWMAKRRLVFPTDKPKKPSIMVTSAVCYNAASHNQAQSIPINIDNRLPAVTLRFVTYDSNELSFKMSIDAYAVLNIGNVGVHQWIANVP